MFCGSSSRCHGLACSVWLWYLLIVLTYNFCQSRQEGVCKRQSSRILEDVFGNIILVGSFVQEELLFGGILECIYLQNLDRFYLQNSKLDVLDRTIKPYILILYSKVVLHTNVRSSRHPRWPWILFQRPKYSTPTLTHFMCGYTYSFYVWDSAKINIYCSCFYVIVTLDRLLLTFLSIYSCWGRYVIVTLDRAIVNFSVNLQLLGSCQWALLSVVYNDFPVISDFTRKRIRNEKVSFLNCN